MMVMQMIKEELKNKIDSSKVISFDIFDTLVTRIVDRPEAVFELIGYKYHINNFCNIRIDAQAKISLIFQKEKHYPHANLDDIYNYIRDNYAIDNTKELKKYELELEKLLLYRNKEIYDIYKYALDKKKRIIIISDMYIEEKDILNILKDKGYKDFSRLYISSKEHYAKFDGTLFDYVIKEENINPSKILHIGDNKINDYDIALSKGINAYYYKGTFIENKSNNGDIVLSLHNGIRRLLSLSNREFWYNIGTIGGLMYLTLYNNLCNMGYKEINFLSRDGYNLYNIFLTLNKNIKVNYIYTSRRALLLPCITTLNDDTLNMLPPFTFGQTVEEILSYINILSLFTKDDLNKVGIDDFSYKIKDIEDFTKIHNLYLLKKDKVLKEFSKERDNAYKYYEQFHFDNKDNLFFDCGWNGSSQYLLENFLPNIKSKFYYTGIFDNAKSKKQLKGRYYDTLLFDIGKNQDYIKKIKNSIIVLELFFGSNEGSVLYFKDGKPILDKESNLEYKDSLYKGLLDYIKFSKDIYHFLNLDISNDDIMRSILRLIEEPTIEEATIIGNLENIDGFVLQKDEVKYIGYITEEQIERNPNIEIYWYQGLLKREDVSNKVKEFVKDKYGFNKKEDNIENLGYLDRLKRSLRNNGYRTTLHLLLEKINKKDDYQEWIKSNELDTYSTLSYEPLISLVVPVYNIESNLLRECVNSVLKQNYSNWELILYDDASTKEETLDTLKDISNIDKRIKVFYHKRNSHISKTTNDGIKESSGEFIALLDNDDVLAYNALYEVVKVLNKDKTLDFIYSDEDKLTEDGTARHYPFFKPDWSIDTFLSLMYVCHFSVFRKYIVDKIGGFTVGLDGAQDYDFVLRFTNETNRIYHIPKILYHWREKVGSIANDPKAKPYALEAIKNLKESYFKKNKINASVIYEEEVYQYRVVYNDFKKPYVIIKSTNQDKTYNMIKFLTNMDIIKDVAILNINNIKLKKDKYKIYSKNIYKELPLLKDDILLFIEDTISIDEDIIKKLVGHAMQKHTGLVSAKILYNNIIYSCGLTPRMPYDILRGNIDTYPIYYCKNRLEYNTYSVSDKIFVVQFNNIRDYKGIWDNLLLGEYLLDKGLFNVIRNDCHVFIDNNNIDNKIFNIEYDPYINRNIDSKTFKCIDNKINKIKLHKYKGNIYESNDNLIYEIGISNRNDNLYIDGYLINKDWKYNNSNKYSVILVKKDTKYIGKLRNMFNTYNTNIYGLNYNFTNFRGIISNIKNYDVYLKVTNKLDKDSIMINLSNKYK